MAIVREGEPGDAIFIVAEGEVRVTTRSRDRSIELAKMGRAACFGEVSLLSGQPRTATVTALTDVVTLVLERTAMEEVFREYPKVRRMLDAVVRGRARDTMDKLVADRAGGKGSPERA
jgi:CRP-like cAMP-binding protein